MPLANSLCGLLSLCLAIAESALEIIVCLVSSKSVCVDVEDNDRSRMYDVR